MDKNKHDDAVVNKREEAMTLFGKRIPLATPITVPKDDPEYKVKREKLDECTREKSSLGRTMLFAVGSVPISIYFRSFIPLLAFSLGAVGYDMFTEYNSCKRERDSLDLLLLKKRKEFLIDEKVRLETKKRILLGETVDDGQQQTNE